MRLDPTERLPAHIAVALLVATAALEQAALKQAKAEGTALRLGASETGSRDAQPRRQRTGERRAARARDRSEKRGR